MTTRNDQIAAAARRLVEASEVHPMTRAEVAKANADGFALRFPAPLGGWLVHEGVIFTDRELERIIARAQAHGANIEET